ncbi:hypothetical protein KTD19_27950 [Burkholderia multivorans]|uniref:hypothetical protein n=1 Tax=Burkholderia multivorans TaxID=87883 RepID=UPI001C231808|nr:hypothetical protein [Burkholderia multivorans]MBU9236212.1 hypothetical protein [Burkholderia multivorans]
MARWTHEEEAVLQQHYQRIGIRVMEMLPGRTERVIVDKARRMRLARHGLTTEKVREALSNGIKTPQKIAELVGVTPNCVRYHLAKLKREKQAVPTGKRSGRGGRKDWAPATHTRDDLTAALFGSSK